MEFYTYGNKNNLFSFMENMISYDTDDVIPGKIKLSHAYRKIRRKYYWTFIKISEYFIFSMGRCCIVFGENRNSLKIQKIEELRVKKKNLRKQTS